MKFQVKRTSDFLSEDAPCLEAVLGRIDRWDVRTFKSAEEFDARMVGRGDVPWFEKGTDHQVIRGPRGGARGIKRKVGTVETWFVDIDTLEAMISFQKHYGQLILTWSDEDDETPMIEIYDDYRE